MTTHNRQDGAVYSLYSFARKAYQAFAGFISGQALDMVGYVSGALVQQADVKDWIYTLGTRVQGISFILGVLLHYLFTHSNRKGVLNLVAELEARVNG